MCSIDVVYVVNHATDNIREPPPIQYLHIYDWAVIRKIPKNEIESGVHPRFGTSKYFLHHENIVFVMAWCYTPVCVNIN